MQEKILQNPKIRTSNIHSSEFGSVSYDIFGSPYQKTGSFLADDSLDFGYLGKPYNADTELYDYGFRDYSKEDCIKMQSYFKNMGITDVIIDWESIEKLYSFE